jgi:hypothetical protein
MVILVGGGVGLMLPNDRSRPAEPVAVAEVAVAAPAAPKEVKANSSWRAETRLTPERPAATSAPWHWSTGNPSISS